MNKITYFSLLILFLSTGLPAFAQDDPCDIFGSVYITKNQYKADFSVYVTEEPGIARIAVYKERAKLMADEPGVWYFSDSENFAKYRVFITDDERYADYVIEYVEERAFAGCQ